MISEIEKMTEIIKKDFEKCPWKKAQTLEKQIIQLRSEIEELEAAVKSRDEKNLEEEIGDVVWDSLNLIFLAERDFRMRPEEIIRQANEKMIRRKPHVFGNEKAETPEDALRFWRIAKEAEKIKRRDKK